MPPPHERDVLSVTALATRAKELLEGRFPAVWVSGEISNFTRASSGHMYFTLKDANSQMPSAFFRGFNLRLHFDPRDGLEVFAKGQLSFFPQGGRCQFIVQEMQPKGLGAAELALRKLKEKLHAKGYFDPRRKRPIKRFPKRVAMVASPTGAAVRDMIELLSQRWPMTEILFRPSRVQGEGAAIEIVQSLRMLNHVHRQGHVALDAIILGRGGGSNEDLGAFNEEMVADAIVQSVVPVISAVGHEIDVSIADLVADRRAETPSAAIMDLSPDQRELKLWLLDQGRRMRDGMRSRIQFCRTRLDQIANRPSLKKPLDRIRQSEQKLDDMAARLQRAMQLRQSRSRDKLASLAEQLQSLSPLNVLKRGYSLTTRPESGELIRDAASLQAGDQILTRLDSGKVVSQVISIEPTN